MDKWKLVDRLTEAIREHTPAWTIKDESPSWTEALKDAYAMGYLRSFLVTLMIRHPEIVKEVEDKIAVLEGKH